MGLLPQKGLETLESNPHQYHKHTHAHTHKGKIHTDTHEVNFFGTSSETSLCLPGGCCTAYIPSPEFLSAEKGFWNDEKEAVVVFGLRKPSYYIDFTFSCLLCRVIYTFSLCILKINLINFIKI